MPSIQNIVENGQNQSMDDFQQMQQCRNENQPTAGQFSPKIKSKNSIDLKKPNSSKKIANCLNVKKFHDEYSFTGITLGQGAHAIVKQINKKNNPSQIYAVKIQRTGDTEVINQIKNTYKNTLMLKHPGVINTLELFIDYETETTYEVMEYCPFPSLLKIIKHLDLKSIKSIIK